LFLPDLNKLIKTSSMKKLSSLFIAFALFCFVVMSSCQGSGTKEEPAVVEEEMVDEAASEVMDDTTEVEVGSEEMTEEPTDGAE
jgi:hypothetical protein